ncbi:MAG: class II aldolase/adducin family protein [Syntrophorhabdales bacterium]
MTRTRRVSRMMSIGLFSSSMLLFAAFSLFPLSGTAWAQAAFNPKPTTAQEAIDFVVMANRILVLEHIFDAFGHVSARNPENPKTFFVARAVAPEQVTQKDILEVDLDGNVVTKSTMRPYAERIIHAAIYKARPEVHSVIHAHPAPIIAFSVSNVPLKPVTNGASRFYPGVPVYDEYDFTSPGNTGMLVTTKDQGDRLAKRLGSGLAVLMRGHGYTVVGSDMPSAVSNAISLRDNAVITLMALQLGTPKYISKEEAQDANRGSAFLDRPWNAWVQRVKAAMPDMR